MASIELARNQMPAENQINCEIRKIKMQNPSTYFSDYIAENTVIEFIG